MTMFSKCKICNKWIPDPNGNSYWKHDPLVEYYTETVCDNCKLEERMFEMIHDFAVSGIVYDGMWGEDYIQRCIDSVLRKYAPKSEVLHLAIVVDFKYPIDSENHLRVEKNNIPWWTE